MNSFQFTLLLFGLGASSNIFIIMINYFRANFIDEISNQLQIKSVNLKVFIKNRDFWMIIISAICWLFSLLLTSITASIGYNSEFTASISILVYSTNSAIFGTLQYAFYSFFRSESLSKKIWYIIIAISLLNGLILLTTTDFLNSIYQG